MPFIHVSSFPLLILSVSWTLICYNLLIEIRFLAAFRLSSRQALLVIKFMDRYKVISTIGDGTFGSVAKGINKATGETVAIKKMKKKFYSWDEAMQLREIKSLRKLNSPFIVKLKEVIRVNDELYFVFEYLDNDVYKIMKNRTSNFTEDKIKSIVYQALQGLAYCHK
jgi:serine/threonine protein kinase